ncbi:MAG: GNAT family N-acetyltransferase [Flavisolibacter sp.]
MEYRIERLSKGRIKDLEKLHAAVYAKSPEKDYYQKKYDTIYTGVEYVGFIVYESLDEPIAYYGVIPCFIEWKNEKYLAAQSADTMTHPDHRFKGMFMDLSNKTFELCKLLNINLVFGFPNQNSYHGAIKLGWKLTECMEFFLIKIEGLPLKSISNKIKFLQIPYNLWRKQVLSKYQKETDGVENSVINEGYAGIMRSEEYKKYKSFSNIIVLEIESVMIWMKISEVLVIGDIQGITENNFNHVIDELKSIAKKLGLKQMHFHCSPGTSLYRFFTGICEPVPSFPVLFQDFGSPVPLEKIKFTFADIDIF